MFASEEPLDYKELQSDRVLLNFFFDTYSSCRPFMKGIHLNLDSWSPYRDPEGCKQETYGLDRYLYEDNLGGEYE